VLDQSAPSGHPKISFCPSVVVSYHQHGAVVFHQRRGRVFASNEVGSRICHGIERKLSPDLILDGIAKEYALPLADARAHFNKFLDDLAGWGLVCRTMSSQ
jgi:hypothetical protein